MATDEETFDWELYERLVCEFGGIADDPIAAANVAKLRECRDQGRACGAMIGMRQRTSRAV